MAKAKSRRGRGAKIGPIDAHVGARLRLRRTLLGMTQTDLGDALGLTFQQVQKYERGTNRISASRLFDLLRVLDVPLEYFFDDMPPRGRGQLASPRWRQGEKAAELRAQSHGQAGDDGTRARVLQDYRSGDSQASICNDRDPGRKIERGQLGALDTRPPSGAPSPRAYEHESGRARCVNTRPALTTINP